MLRISSCLAACVAAAAGAAHGAEALSAHSPWMSGDWGGSRSAWLAQGIDLKLGYTGETSTLLRGGYHSHDRATRYADQFNLGADLDLQKLLGWNDAAFSIGLTNRNGAHNLNEKISAPGASGMGSTQEIQGRGSVTRLSELWLSKGWFGDAINLKAGRFAVSDDFAIEDCLFQGLAFCGSQPGNYVNNIYNGPISQWAARLRYRLAPALYAQVGAFNVNPSNLNNDNGLKLYSHGTTGTLVPVELVWAPALNGLPGEYRLGYYHSTAQAPEVGDAGSEHDRHGGWVVAKQQLTTAGGNRARGLTLIASATFQDSATTAIDRYQKLSLVYKGPFATRPADTLGLGIARIHGSDRLLAAARANNRAGDLLEGDAGYLPEQHSEYAAELNYGLQATGWLNLMPNLQYVKRPDGVRGVQNALVLGLQVQTQF
ncbi:carbohydrate porin [Pseudomonas sp. NPDC007930]|uniref:carbohydrate porin n=1 Tax=Pseudomonas sp. NPDC007930 TaxID=3364417 RepID=UPI0036EE2395